MRRLERLIISCACGCGTQFENRDSEGRLRKYVSGHNTPIKYEDPTQHKREWNHRNRESRYEYKKSYHRKRRLKLIETKGNKCQDCSLEYNGKNASIFHFHHTDPSTKLFNIGNKVTVLSWKKILEEANKCIMICANCHELRHGENY